MIHGGEEGSIASVCEGIEEEVDFIPCEHMRKGFVADDLDLAPDLPALVEVIAKEGAKCTDRLVHRAAREIAFVLDVQQEVEYLMAGEIRGVKLWVMGVELTNPAEVGISRAFT